MRRGMQIFCGVDPSDAAGISLRVVGEYGW
jgi:hypothetical protein